VDASPKVKLKATSSKTSTHIKNSERPAFVTCRSFTGSCLASRSEATGAGREERTVHMTKIEYCLMQKHVCMDDKNQPNRFPFCCRTCLKWAAFVFNPWRFQGYLVSALASSSTSTSFFFVEKSIVQKCARLLAPSHEPKLISSSLSDFRWNVYRTPSGTSFLTPQLQLL
jgi:hypothetical protein